MARLTPLPASECQFRQSLVHINECIKIHAAAQEHQSCFKFQVNIHSTMALCVSMWKKPLKDMCS
jgi:hypothetical protein